MTVLVWPSFAAHRTDPILWSVTGRGAFQMQDGTIVEMLEGFTSDGESGPEKIKSLLFKPDNRRLMRGMWHDLGYQAGLPKDWCDRLFYELGKALGIDDETNYWTYEAVHLFGSSSYRLDQQDIAKAHDAVAHLRITLPTR